MIGVGSAVGKYVVRAKIGEGAMGTVYLAQHTSLDSRVAVKVIRRDGSEREEDVSRFFSEARAASKIGHENIVHVLDVGTTPTGEPYYIMELLTGESLAARMGRGIRPLGEVLHVAMQVAGGLAASHGKGIVHRDLKPANVFLIKRGEDASFVKLLDFGVAKTTDAGEEVKHRTTTGRLLGTPHYMAPEQVAGVRTVDGRADVYALGVMLFELTCGRLPFDAPKWTEVLIQHVTRPPPRARSINPDCPLWLDRLIDRALAKSPADRPTMAAMRDALHLAGGGEHGAGAPDEVDPASETLSAAMPTAATADTLYEAKPPSNPQPPPEVRPGGFSVPGEEGIVGGETVASTDPKIAREAQAKLARRAQRRVLAAVVIGVVVGGAALTALLAGLDGADSASAAGPRAGADAGPSDAAARRQKMADRRMQLRLQRLKMLDLPGTPAWVVDALNAPERSAGGGHGGHEPDMSIVTDASVPIGPPPQRLDGYDVEVAMRPTREGVRECRDRYEDLVRLDVTLVVASSGEVIAVQFPSTLVGTPFSTCATRVILATARFPRFLQPEQRIAYEYAFGAVVP